MTDTPPTTTQPVSEPTHSLQGNRSHLSQIATAMPYDGGEGRREYYGQSQTRTPQGAFNIVPPFQQQHVPSSTGRQDSFNMSSLGSNLPEVYQNYGNVPAPRFSDSHSPSTAQFQPQSAQFSVPGGMTSPPGTMQYNYQYQPQYQGVYAAAQQPPNHLANATGIGGQYYQGQSYVGAPQQPGTAFYAQPAHYGAQNQLYLANVSGHYVPRGGYGVDVRGGAQHRGSDMLGSHAANLDAARSASIGSSAGQSSVVRGPPRKPRQSGHAIWIGNLPPHTDLMSLVVHVCKEAPDLESLFLISKSNCAFANFKDEESCATAQGKIHDSRFQTVRLVSRLRRSSVGAGVTAAPSGPAALTPPAGHPVARTPSPDTEARTNIVVGEKTDIPAQDDTNLPKDKFFVVKSLTVEDLELSVRNGIWATQSHNEETLNKAYKAADNVYLIFSANKSGEYFGYAKMVSPINNDPAAAIEFAPKAHTVEDPELPKAIPTPATESTPKGRIIDDSARGTIFWEVERDENDGSDEEDDANSDQDLEASSRKAWGKPFKLEWISTTRLPFYRTRGLRNPWNSNREVKIARDGTELEPGVGRRLLGLFHRLPSPVAPQMPAMGVYPQMRFQ